MLGQVDDELGELFSKGSRERLCRNRKIVDDPQHIFQASSFPVKLALGVPLPCNLNAVRLVFCSQF